MSKLQNINPSDKELEDRASDFTKEELIKEYLHLRKLLFDIQDSNRKYIDELKALKSSIYKAQDWDSVKLLLNHIR